jgi:hypothetical protein
MRGEAKDVTAILRERHDSMVEWSKDGEPFKIYGLPSEHVSGGLILLPPGQPPPADAEPVTAMVFRGLRWPHVRRLSQAGPPSNRAAYEETVQERLLLDPLRVAVDFAELCYPALNKARDISG